MTTNTATPIFKWPGKHGTVVVWKTPDGNVSTSSAHHQIAPSWAMDPQADLAWLSRTLTGRMPVDNMVSETVAFAANDQGNFYGSDEVGRHEHHESHEEAIRDAGYIPAPIPDDLPWRDDK